MVSITKTLCVVYKNTGGRLWNKPWGLPGLTKTQKANRKKNEQRAQQVNEVLRIAKELEPAHLQRTPTQSRQAV